jgi:hypothetical protein
MDNFSSLKAFLLIIGNARSGSTLLGSIINSHPQAIIANETYASRILWENLSQEQIFNTISQNVLITEKDSYLPSGYRSIPKVVSPLPCETLILGEKIWNPSTLLLHGKYNLIEQLTKTVNRPVLLIHAIRNPFDAIATMHVRSGAPIDDRIAWYFMHCESVKAIEKRKDQRLKHVYHEDLIANTASEIESICNFLDIPVITEHLSLIIQSLYKTPHQSRTSIMWDNKDIDRIYTKMREFDFLSKYLKP